MFGLFSSHRRLAIQIVEKVESDLRSKPASELIDMIIWGSKNLPNRDQLSDIDCVILSADGIVHNETAAVRLKRELNLTDGELNVLRSDLSIAVLEFAFEKGRWRAASTILESNRQRNQQKET